MQTARSNSHPSWLVPSLVAAVAAPTFVAFWIGDRPGLGAAWAGASIAFALLLLVGGRSDTIRMLRGEADDERTFTLEYQAMTITAVVLVVALAGLFLAAGVRGESGVTYAALLILAELTHLGALAVLNRMS
jgi:protein-S-isoprenylcysteine O-methyltransferase Ste14